MLNTLRRFIASLTAVILLGSIALPALTAYADNSGTLNVVVSPAAGSYEVLDDATGAVVIGQRAGSMGFTIPAGDYRVNFLPLAGYTTPTFEHISLLPGGIVTVTGLYVQNNSNSGTLHVVVSPNSATFEVKDDATGATVISTRANSQNFTLPYGDYVTEFKPLGGYTAPAADHFTIDAANPEHTSTGNYTAVSNSGTLTVNVSPATGRYEIRDDATGAIMATERAGSGVFTFANGDYLVDFKDIPNYVTPADAHVTLDAAHTAVVVDGTYTVVPVNGTVTVNVSPATGTYEIRDNATGVVVLTQRTGSGNYTLPFGDYVAVFGALNGYQTPANQAFTLNLANPSATINGNYNTTPSTGSVIVNVTNQNGIAISDADWTLRSCTGATLATCTVNYSNSTQSTALLNVPAATYGLFFNTTPGYSGATVLSLNPQALTSGNTITFDLQYIEIAQTGTVQINVRDNLGAPVIDGRWNLAGTTPQTGTATQTVVAAVGNYSLTAVIPAGNTNYSSVSVSPSTSQSLANGATLTFDVTYTLATATTGIINVTQAGGLGTVNLVGPSPATINTASYTDATATPGSYTLAITAPAGTTLVDVRDANNNVLTTPYTQALAANGTIGYTVNYAPVTTTGTVTVNQVGTTSTVNLLGPSPAVIATATYANALAGTGSYTLSVSAPAGFNLVDVRDQNNNVLAAPYTQALATGGAITYNVNFAPSATTATLSITTTGALGSVTVNGTLLGTYDGINALTTTVNIGAVNTISFGAVATFTTPADIVIAANTLVANSTTNYVGNYIPTANAATVTVTTVGALGAVSLNGNLLGTYDGTTPISAIIDVTLANTLSFGAVAGFTTPANIVIAANTLAAGSTTSHVGTYVALPATATLSVTTTGALGAVTVNGTLLGTYDGTNALTTTVSVGAVNTISFGNVATFTTPADIVIPANTLVANSTTNYVGAYILTANAATVTVTTVGALGAVSLNGNLLGTYDGITPISAIVDVTLANTLSFGAVAGFTTPANIVIPANTLAPASTTPYVGTYVAIGSNTTINVTQVGGLGTVTLTGSSPATVNTASYTDVNATAGSYTVAITAPLGTVLVDVRDAGNNVLAAPYTQALAVNGTISYTVNYAPVGTSGTVTVNQVGTTGTVTLLGPTPANVTTATYTNAQSGTGSYTLGAIAAPAGFNLVDVRDGNNNVIAAPYTQALATGATIVYNVNYAAIPATGTLTVTQIGATGTVNLFGPSPATIVASPYSNASAVTGNYTLSLTAPAGFILVDVRDTANAVILPPYAQTLVANGTIAYTVNYAPVGTFGTVRVNQIGGTGTLDLIGPSPAYITTTPYSNAQAGTGSYTLLGITAPVGTLLVDVRDGNNNVLVAPYTQALATGATITYNINYTPATAFTLIKSANVASVNDNGIVTYTITLVRNTNVAGSISATLSDTVTGTGTITGANGGSALYIPNSGTCTGVTCSGQQIALAPITVTLDNPGSTATLTYQVRAFNTSVVGASSIATNTVTATIANFPIQTATSPVSLVANAAPVGPTNGSTGSSSSTGGSGGYKLKKGDMKLDLQKLVSLDGVNFVTPDAGRSLALAVPENKATRLYTKLLMNVQGDVSAVNIKLRHFFDTGKSDMTADDLENLAGAHVDNRGLLTVDKVKVGETATLTYSVLVHENGRNINPAVDGLELVSFGSNLPPMQDGLTYLGLGSQVKTYLYAGSVPANADQTQGEAVPGNGSVTDLAGVLGLDVRANKPVANIGDTVTFTIALRNLTDGDMTNVFIDHTFDTDAFEMADAYGARTDANGIHWKQPLLRPGQEVNLSFKLLVKNSAPVGAMVTGQTRVLVSEYEGIPPVENAIRIGAAGQTMQLAQTGPAGILGLLMVLSALAALAHGLLRNALYLRNKRLALQSL